MNYIQAYSIPLVLLSLIISILASYSTLNIVQKVFYYRGRSRTIWIVLGSFTMGLGIWAMHFVGMLAFHTPFHVEYDLTLLTVSMLLPILAAFVALKLAAREVVSQSKYVAGSLFMGLAIAGMHYIGMAAMIIPGRITYDPFLFAMSLLIAVAVSFTALRMAFQHRRDRHKTLLSKRVAASCLFGLAIAGMHYTGMFAARISIKDDEPHTLHTMDTMHTMMSDTSFSQYQLAFLIGVVTLLILVVISFSQLIERKLAVRLAKFNEARYRFIFEHNPDMVCLYDLNGQLLGVNPATERITGYSAGELLGRQASEFIDQPERGKVLRKFKKVLRGQPQTFELSILDQKGERLFLHTSIVPLMMNGVIIDIYSISKNITALMKTKKELHKATQAKGEFLANMSHEIRTPVNAVVGLTYLLLETELDENQKDYVHKVQSASRSLVSIINDTLDFSKMEAGKLELESAVFQLDRVLEDVSNLVSLDALQKGLDLYFISDWMIPGELIGDPLRLGQILTNLTTNAIKFTEKGEIVISSHLLSISGSSVTLRFSVKDSGIGLTKEQKTEIFQAFAQADRSTTRKYGGTGLGLTISQRLIEMMNGHITIESTLGEGSVFAFTATFGIYSGSQPQPPQLTEQFHILVYDHSETSRQMLERALQPAPLSVTFLQDGQEVIDSLEQEKNGKKRYDFILLDWNTDKSNSFQLFYYLTNSSLATGISFMVMVDFLQMKADALRDLLKSNAVLVKPLLASQLLSTLYNALQSNKINPLPETFPRREPHRSDDTEEERYSRILIVEDNELNRLVYQELFKPHFEQVVLADNGWAAVEAIRTNLSTFDIILMDVEMAGLDGYETTGMIREYDREVPIIAHTAHNTASEERNQEAGMNGFVPKPADPKQLIASVKRWARSTKRGKAVQPSSAAAKLLPEPVSPVLPPKEALIRVDVLLQRLGGNYSLVSGIFKVFLTEYADFMTKIRRCIDNSDYTSLKLHIHNLKGVAGNLSFDSLFHFLQEFEQVVQQMEKMKLHAMVNQLALLMDSVNYEVADWVKKGDSTQRKTSMTE